MKILVSQCIGMPALQLEGVYYPLDKNGCTDVPDSVATAWMGWYGITAVEVGKQKTLEPIIEAVIDDSDYNALSLEELVELAVAGKYDTREYSKIKNDKTKMIGYIKSKMS